MFRTSSLMWLALALTVACDSGDGKDDDEVIDSDGDGLTDAEEADLGTDPQDDDSDDDGYGDGEEHDAGTNPNQAYSHPYTGGYNVGACDALPDATGPTGAGSNDDGSLNWTA